MRRTLAPALLLVVAGCAVMAEENRRTLNALDAHVAPESTGARWALAPVALPVGVTALAVDAVVVHPATVIDDAWGDTVDLLWTPRDETGFREAVMIPVAAVATPFVFAGDFLGRALFAFGPRTDDAAGGSR